MVLFFVVLGFCVIAVGIAYQLELSNKSNEQVLALAVGFSSKLSQKPLIDSNTADSPSYTTSPRDEPSKNVSTARAHASSSQHSPSSDVVTAKSPVYEAPSRYKFSPVKNEQQPSNDVQKTATLTKIKKDQPSTAVSASSANISTTDKRVKKKNKKHKKNELGARSETRVFLRRLAMLVMNGLNREAIELFQKEVSAALM